MTLLLLSLLLLAVVEGLTERKRRDIEDCPAPTPVTLGTPAQATMFSGDAALDCALFTFTLPPSFSSDLSLQFSLEGQFNSPDVWLLTEKKYSGEYSDDYEFRFDPSVAKRIPNCALHSSKFYVKVSATIESGNVDVTFTLNALPPQQERVLPQGSTVIEGTFYPGVWDYVTIATPDPTKAYRITVIVPPENGLEISFSDFRCPTESERRNPNLYSLEAGGANTRYPNRPVHFAVYHPSLPAFPYPLNYTFEISYTPVECQTANYNFQVCENVDYPTTLTDPQLIETIEEELFDEFYVYGGGCIRVMKAISCAYFFPRCDSNGFPLLPCDADCAEYDRNCAFFDLEGGNLQDYFDVIPCDPALADVENEKYCYDDSSSSSLAISFFLMMGLLLSFSL